MKIEYTAPEMEILFLENEDIIVTSNTDARLFGDNEMEGDS